ncbi:GIY-YIG nuclease family protein, partial [Microbacterium sp.]|uniref:GIY-YIG nuclease family protein n=1 Tax=Microbacterium sp. TaxID=51671 RepID=UPI0037CB93BC
AHDVITELGRVGLGHSNILPGHPRGQARSDVTYSCSSPLLRCNDGSFYTGSTARDIEQRVWEHNHADRGAVYTRRRRPVALVWCASDGSIERVVAWEKRIQGWSRAKKQALIDGRMSDLPGLSRSASDSD